MNEQQEIIACQSFRELLEQQMHAIDMSSESRHANAIQAIGALESAHNRDVTRLEALIGTEVNRLNEVRELKNTGLGRELHAEIEALVKRQEEVGHIMIENHMAIHSQLSLAQDKLEKSIDERFERSNRFREQINNERAEFVRRDVMEGQFEAMRAQITASLESFEKRLRPIESFRLQAVGVGAVLIIVVTLVDFIIRTAAR